MTRCPDHNLALTSAGRCNGCHADHLAGEHHTPVPDCPRCTSPEPVEDAKTRAAGERPWSPTDAARTA